MFRAVMGPAGPVTVPTRYGELVFRMRMVWVYGPDGREAGSFACEDTPEDFDAKAAESGWVRVGHDPKGVWLERAPSVAALPRGGSRVGGTSCLGLLFVLLVLVAGMVSALF